MHVWAVLTESLKKYLKYASAIFVSRYTAACFFKASLTKNSPNWTKACNPSLV